MGNDVMQTNDKVLNIDKKIKYYKIARDTKKRKIKGKRVASVFIFVFVFSLFLSQGAVLSDFFNYTQTEDAMYITEFKAPKESESYQEVRLADSIDLLKQISEVEENIVKEQFATEIEEVSYTMLTQKNPSLDKGVVRVVKEGIPGEKEVYKKLTYIGDVLRSEIVVSETITKKPQAQITEVGTKELVINSLALEGLEVIPNVSENSEDKLGENEESIELTINNSNKQPITVTVVGVVRTLMQVSADSTLKLREGPGEDFKSLKSVKSGTQLISIGKVQRDGEEWIRVICNGTRGFIKAIHSTNVEISKYTNLGKIKVNAETTSMKTPSGLSLEEFERIIDEYVPESSALKGTGKYFYAAEQLYGINGVMLAGIAMNESGKGTSNFAVNRYNFFGWNASTNDPNNANNFKELYMHYGLQSVYVDAKEYSILHVAGCINGSYLTPGGGCYSGTSLSSMNKKYAADQNWAVKAANGANAIYNLL